MGQIRHEIFGREKLYFRSDKSDELFQILRPCMEKAEKYLKKNPHGLEILFKQLAFLIHTTEKKVIEKSRKIWLRNLRRLKGKKKFQPKISMTSLDLANAISDEETWQKMVKKGEEMKMIIDEFVAKKRSK